MFASLRVTKLIGVLGIAAMFGMTGSASAGIEGSAHDLTGSGFLSDGTTAVPAQGSDQICIFCHTPHNRVAEGTAVPPLWNRDANAVDYTLYADGGGTYGTLGMASTACLGCHDGAVAINQFGPASTRDTPGSTMTAFPSKVVGAGETLIGQHPVGVNYATAPGDFNATPTAAKLFSGQVECGSCHDPHGGVASTKLLVLDNANSALCLDCHTK